MAAMQAWEGGGRADVFPELIARLAEEFEKLKSSNEDMRKRNLALSSELGMMVRVGAGGRTSMSDPAPGVSRPAPAAVVPEGSDLWGALSPVLPSSVGEEVPPGQPHETPEAAAKAALPERPKPQGGPPKLAALVRSLNATSAFGAAKPGARGERQTSSNVPGLLSFPKVQASTAKAKRSKTTEALSKLKMSTEHSLTTFEHGGALGQFVENSSQVAVFTPREEKPATFQAKMVALVESTTFEMCFALLIMINTVFMALEVQYRGMDIGFQLSFLGNGGPAVDSWPGIQPVFAIMETVFGVVFFLEVIVKLVFLRLRFVKSGWNIFDSIVVAFWLIEKGAKASLAMNPMTLRVLRLGRLVRLARMIKTVQALDSLQVLIGSILASFSVLFWSCVILMVAQVLVALFFQNLLTPFMTDESIDLETRQTVFRYFGTFTRSMITMFEMTLANWIVVCRVLADNVSEWYALAILIYKLVMGFSVVNVITGVFLHETFRVASTDDDLMIVQRKRAMKKHSREMEKLFRLADKSNDGYISRAEFRKVLEIPKVKTWLAAMDLEVEDYDLLFDFLDDGDGLISADELMRGVCRLRGTARSIDLVAVMRKMLNMQQQISDVAELTTSLVTDLGLAHGADVGISKDLTGEGEGEAVGIE